MTKTALVGALLWLVMAPAWGLSPFTVQAIRVEGLQRIEVGTVFNYLPIKVGDTLDETRAAAAVRALFKTGFFSDVRLERDGGTLVVVVAERPSIAKVDITGNHDIKTEDLKDGLKHIGLTEGRVFDRSLLEEVERELERQYYTRGKYGVKITAEVKPRERNQVEVDLHIDEGHVAKIREVNVVGNKVFSSAELAGTFQLSPPSLSTLFSDNDQYSRQKLTADLESLRAYYLDRGYINFSIDSTQVAISPDKKEVSISVEVTEGERYTISGVRLSGDFVVPEQELRDLVSVAPGQVFSRHEITESANRISERLGRDGYAFANINPVPEVDRASRTVKLNFVIDPGRRVYVQRVDVSGNIRTQDEVIRREIRQMEGGWLSTDQINLSKTRLQRLGYFDEVNVETPVVPGVDDQVDVNLNVKERTSFGSLSAGVGYSQDEGVLLNASISQDNFLGNGERVALSINNSEVSTVYSFSYTNPYYTPDGVSRGFQAFYRSTDAAALSDVAPYTSDSYGTSVTYGMPLTEVDGLRVTFGLEETNVEVNPNTSLTDSFLGLEENNLGVATITPPTYAQFINEHGANFTEPQVTLGWNHDTRDRAIFPNRGGLNALSLETTVPGGSLNYYKLSDHAAWYHGLTPRFTFLLNGDVAYGGSYGSSAFPFFENFYAGGIHSVRGYRDDTLGPSYNGFALGGAFRTLASMELQFAPLLSGKAAKNFRLGWFVDSGQVFASAQNFAFGGLRYSSGLSAIWLSPIGPLTFSLGQALNAKPGDHTEIFQFSLGTTF